MKPIYSIVIILLWSCQSSTDNIVSTPINENGLVCHLYSKPENLSRPLILFLPGSGKNMMDKSELGGLIDAGYDVLSVTYYGAKNLPDRIAHVNLEYINECVQWIKSKISDQRKVVILGVSRGAELALLYASHYNNIDGLICYSPSHIVLPDHVGVDNEKKYKSSWLINNEEVEYAPLRKFDDAAGKIVYRKYFDELLDTDDSMGVIKVENIDCPTLLLSGRSDMVWPSYAMSFKIADRMKTNGKDDLLKIVSYENAGHQIFWTFDKIPERAPSVQSLRLTGIKKHKFLFGGTEEGTINAMITSRIEMLRFLDDINI